MAMSRDGLLPPIFSAIHPRFKTPWFSTIVTGIVVAVPSLFMNLTEVTDLTSIGTLFAFVLVSGGILILDASKQKVERRFKVPYINSRFIAPLLYVLVILGVFIFQREALFNFFSATDPSDPAIGAWDVLKHRIPLGVFVVLATVLVYYCYRKSLSLIPVLGVLTCGYLMTELGITNWMRFLLWLIVGLTLYFFYGHSHSHLGRQTAK